MMHSMRRSLSIIGSCDNNFEVHPTAVDLSNGVVVSDVICASILGSLLLVSLAEYQGAYLLTGTVGQYNPVPS